GGGRGGIGPAVRRAEKRFSRAQLCPHLSPPPRRLCHQLFHQPYGCTSGAAPACSPPVGIGGGPAGPPGAGEAPKICTTIVGVPEGGPACWPSPPAGGTMGAPAPSSFSLTLSTGIRNCST